jgi:hypothetical protein
METADSLAETFPLLRPVAPESAAGLHRFSVTQLINYRRCPRSYYFDRVLHVTSSEEMAVWNDAEAPEPPANLTATLKGAVIHRFCETYSPGDDPTTCLRQSFADLIRLRQAQFADRLIDIDCDRAIDELLPLVKNYLSSAVFERVNQARSHGGIELTKWPGRDGGLWSELGFRFRRPMGILTGAIDKLLVTPASNNSFDIEIIDFKTNRFRSRAADMNVPSAPAAESRILGPRATRALVRENRHRSTEQFAFDFSAAETAQRAVAPASSNSSLSLNDEILRVASDYQLQMQAYALAVRELLPIAIADRGRIKVTLHFLDPNVEYSLPDELLSPSSCSLAIDAAMAEIISARDPETFPVRPARHCRMCNFLDLCAPGRAWLSRLHWDRGHPARLRLPT